MENMVANTSDIGVKSQSKGNKEWMYATLVAVVLVVLLRYFVFGVYVVSGVSMQPNLHNGTRLIVNKLAYNVSAPQRGDVIILHATSTDDYVKRIVALPGEKVRVQGDFVVINGQALEEPYLAKSIAKANEAGNTYNTIDSNEITIPVGYVFVLGDNRPNSKDSRMLGPIAIDELVGRADISFWPLNQLHLVKTIQ